MAYESPLTIADVVKDISANKYVLPSIQREFVWSTSQIEKLFDSVMQDYPFGAFLFWNCLRIKILSMTSIPFCRIIMRKMHGIIRR